MYLLILIGHSLAMYRGKQMQRECFKVLAIIPLLCLVNLL